RRLTLFEAKRLVSRCVHYNGIPFDEGAFQHAKRQRIEHAPLDRPLERAGAVRRIIPLADQIFFGAVAELDVNLPLFEPPDQTGELDVDNPLHVLAPESME